MKILKDDSGQAMILTLLCMTCLLGFVGFAVDVGVLLNAKRQMQTAADSAAIAGASELNYGDMTTAADTAAAQNGVTVGVNGGTVAINTPPLSGAYVGKTGYVEAIVSQDQPTFFMKMFNFASMKVSARAVATNKGSADGCVYVCSQNASPAMDLQGSFNVSASHCGVVVDSNSSQALNFTGGGGSLTAGSVGVVGQASGKTGDSNPAPVTGIAPETCPLSNLVLPNPALMTCTTPSGGNLTGTISAGCYSAPAGKKGVLGTLTLTNVTLGSGTYVFEGNVSLNGTVTSAAGGTTLDIYNGAMSEGTNTTLNLVAPTSGDYNGIAILQPPSNTNAMLFDFGSSNGLIDGIIDAPGAAMELHDSGGDSGGGLRLITDLIVNTLSDKTATLTVTSYSQSVNNSPLTKVALVE